MGLPVGLIEGTLVGPNAGKGVDGFGVTTSSA